MPRKAFLIQVELDVQAVTCPGVWLCSNGKVSLQIYMLDSCVQTASYKPNFPIQCNEKFVFYKTFFAKHQLSELQNELHDQWLYVELVQWQSCEIGNVLATFQTTLDELLYPSTISGSIAGVDLDLLMEPSKTFPGTISPKIEVSTKTTIEETLCVCNKPTSSTVIVNPKVLISTEPKPRGSVCRKVCHSVAYSKLKKPLKTVKKKPPFIYRKAEDDLILRKPHYEPEGKVCICRKSRSLERQKCVSVRKSRPEIFSKPNEQPSTARVCTCTSGHKENFCPVCSKYSGYFHVTPIRMTPEERLKNEIPTQNPRTTLYNEPQRCYRHSRGDRCPCCRPVAFATSDEKTNAESDSEQEREKSCCCITQKPSLAEKLHAKLTKTLSSIPKTTEWSCVENEYESDCCDCPTSRAELYKDLQKFYGDLYEKARTNPLCVPDCTK